jgi:hypothetical protein
MRPVRWVTAMSLVGLPACANVWGFANLTSEDHDAMGADGSTSDSTAPGDGPAEGGALDADAGQDVAAQNPCNLGNSSGCRGKCPNDASPCGCLVDYGTRTTYCSVTGTGGQGTGCGSDLDCAPGYGCLMSTGQCTHWCRPTSTTCPVGTCNTSSSLIFNTNEQFGFCY